MKKNSVYNYKLKIGYIYSKRGFTLLEVTTVMAVMLILLAVGMVSLTSSRRAAAFKTARNEVTAAIKLAQSYALQGRITGAAGTDAPCQYGFRFTSSSTYQIFYRTICSAPLGSITEVETKNLKNGVTFNSIDPPANSEITFSVPHGTVTNPRTFQFSIGGTTDTKTVSVNGKGNISE